MQLAGKKKKKKKKPKTKNKSMGCVVSMFRNFFIIDFKFALNYC